MDTVMKVFLTLAAALFLTACVNEDRYPVSGEECTAEDPVKQIDSSMTDCVPASGM
ncbi:hypothetical protein [Roseovarius sp.]|jgi:outer membrane biogenesis lipoprotein LolB